MVYKNKSSAFLFGRPMTKIFKKNTLILEAISKIVWY